MAETEQKPFCMTLGDGTVVKGATMEEAFQTLAKMKVDTANAYKAEKAEKERLAGEKTLLEGQIQSLQNPPKEGKAGEFDAQKYYKLLNEDPMAANDYWFEQRFQMSPDQVTSQFQYMNSAVSNLTQQSVTAAFVAQHSDDFPASAEAARAMNVRMTQLVNSGIPFNLDTMNYAYSALVTEGVVKPNEAPEKKEEANPQLSGASGGANQQDAAFFEKMSDADMEKLARSKGWM